jgi:GTP cyclohydrolase I
MTPIKVLPSRTEDLEDLPAATKEEIENTACAHGAAEDEVDSNPTLREFYRGILTEVGEDPHRIGLLRTPHRAAKAMEYLTSGYSMDIEKVLNGAIFEEKYDEIAILRQVPCGIHSER